MKTPFHLAEHGYAPDPADPTGMRFINSRGHPWHPVTLRTERQHNHGECIEAMIRAAYDAGIGEGIPIDMLIPPEPDPQCDACRWMTKRKKEVARGEGTHADLHCVMHRERVENCPQQEIEHSHPAKSQ